MDTIYIFIFKFSFILGEKIVANFAVKSVRDLTCKTFLREFGIITFKIFRAQSIKTGGPGIGDTKQLTTTTRLEAQQQMWGRATMYFCKMFYQIFKCKRFYNIFTKNIKQTR